MPEGMADSSKFPKITEALLRKGYAEPDIRKILGENTLRVIADCEKVAHKLQSEKA
jgi:membrane dipeptidase